MVNTINGSLAQNIVDAVREVTDKNRIVFFINQVMGVIGITGEPSEATQFGFLAAKITEVFIKEKQLAGNYESRKKMVQYLMNICIYEKKIDEEQIKEILEKLRIKEMNEYYCSVIEVPKKNKDFVAIENRILHTLGQYNVELYIYNYPNRFVILVPKNLLKEFESVIRSIDIAQEYMVNCGVGSKMTIFQF